MQKQETKILVLGAGESGTGAAILAKSKGLSVFVSDNGSIRDEYKQMLQKANVSFEEKGHTKHIIEEFDEIIKSPGIPDKAPIIKDAINQGIPIIDEIEFAARYNNSFKICITGSNGKTTTTLLTEHIFKQAGIDAVAAGNMGKSFALMTAKEKHDVSILELSSFQLDHMYEFKADIAILTNITPDHMDRYNHSMSDYTASKFRIINNMTSDGKFIYNLDDKITAENLMKYPTNAQPFAIGMMPHKHSAAWTDNGQMIININNNPLHMMLESLALQGRHNLYDSMAAAVAARLFDIKRESIKKSLSDFQHIEHRLEFVAKVHGIEFINDSKATNINSTWYALESMTHPVIWIAGGTDKGNDYSELIPLVKEKVKALVCLGADNSKLIKAFSGHIPVIIETGSARDAVEQAYYLGKPGDVVLLSPACASFDLFENYEDRGKQFKFAIREL